MIRVADHVVDMGPGAGSHGGTIVYEGTVDGLLELGTATGRHLDVRRELKPEPRVPRGSIPIRNARLHNLQGRLGRRAGRPARRGDRGRGFR